MSFIMNDIFSFLNSYGNHEEEIGQLAAQMGFLHVSLSSCVMPMIKVVPRGYTGEYICKIYTWYCSMATLHVHAWNMQGSHVGHAGCM